MTDPKRFTDFDPIETPSIEDVLPIVDVSEDENKTVSIQQLQALLAASVRLGSTFFDGNTDLTSITTQGEFVKVVGPYESGASQGTVHNDGRLTAGGFIPAFYRASCTLTVDDGAGTLVGVRFRVIPAEGAPFLCGQCLGTSQIPPGGGEQNVVVQALLPLEPGDSVEVWVANLTSTSDLQIKNLNFDLVEIR